jgi:hypothetical protein
VNRTTSKHILLLLDHHIKCHRVAFLEVYDLFEISETGDKLMEIVQDSVATAKRKFKGGLTPRQELATCCLQHFLVMIGNITKKCCR